MASQHQSPLKRHNEIQSPYPAKFVKKQLFQNKQKVENKIEKDDAVLIAATEKVESELSIDAMKKKLKCIKKKNLKKAGDIEKEQVTHSEAMDMLD